MDLPANRELARLNPFAFPSDTTFRFVLLIISVLGVSAFFYDSLFFTYNARYVLETWQQCQERASAAHPNDADAFSAAFSECRAPVAQSEALWTLGGMALLLLIAGLIFLVFPSWKIWRNDLEPLSSNDAPDIVAYVIQLCHEIELVHTPIILCAPLNGTIGGLVFGYLGRYYLVVNGGLVTQFYKDREAFRAVVLHELAHLRNADVDKTYFSVAIWQAFVIAALIPYTISLVFRPADIGPVDTLYLISVAWRLIALAAIVFLTYKAVLRVREVYADIRASVHHGIMGSLDRILATLQTAKPRRWEFLQAHPDPKERRRTLIDTSTLFRMGFWEAFATGVVAMIAFSNIYSLLSSLTTGKQKVLWVLTGGEFAAYGAALIFVPPIAGVIVLGIWRERFAGLVQGISSGGETRLALGLAFGAVLGQFLSMGNVLDSASSARVTALGFNVVWIVLLLAFLLFLVQWVADTASQWLGVTMSMASARQITIAIIFTSALLLFLFGPMFLLYTLGLPIAQDGNLFLALLTGLLGGFVVSASYFHTVLAFISLWAFPLASLFWRNAAKSTVASDWVFLEPSPQNLSLPNQEELRIRKSLLTGLVGGLIWCGFIIGIHVIAGVGVPEFSQANSQQVSQFVYRLFSLAALSQAIIAIVAASWTKQLRMVNGLLAAFVAGCVMTGGLTALLQLLVGGTPDAGVLWNFFSNVIGMGALLSLLLFGLAFGLVKWVGRLRFRQKTRNFKLLGNQLK